MSFVSKEGITIALLFGNRRTRDILVGNTGKPRSLVREVFSRWGKRPGKKQEIDRPDD